MLISLIVFRGRAVVPGTSNSSFASREQEEQTNKQTPLPHNHPPDRRKAKLFPFQPRSGQRGTLCEAPEAAFRYHLTFKIHLFPWGAGEPPASHSPIPGLQPPPGGRYATAPRPCGVTSAPPSFHFNLILFLPLSRVAEASPRTHGQPAASGGLYLRHQRHQRLLHRARADLQPRVRPQPRRGRRGDAAAAARGRGHGGQHDQTTTTAFLLLLLFAPPTPLPPRPPLPCAGSALSSPPARPSGRDLKRQRRSSWLRPRPLTPPLCPHRPHTDQGSCPGGPRPAVGTSRGTGAGLLWDSGWARPRCRVASSVVE